MKLWQIGYNGRINPKHYKSSLFASSHRRRWRRHFAVCKQVKIETCHAVHCSFTVDTESWRFFSKLYYLSNKSNLLWKCSRSLQFSFFWQRCIWFLLLNDEERVEIIQVHYAVAGRKHVGVSQPNSVYIIIVYYAMRQHTEIPEIIQ